MVTPYRQPELGSKPRLYRLIRDDTYHTAGTILCLNEDQVTGYNHERIHVALEPDDAAMIEALAADVEALKRVLAALRAALVTPADPAAETPTRPA